MNQIGKEITTEGLTLLLNHLISFEIQEQFIRPLFIWGKPGIGKTEFIKEYASKSNLDFYYCAPAQFEEMGDLHGMPEIENNVTVFRRPSWLPEENDNPSILLLDDFNRADNRIIKGLMQLLQFNELISWKLPKNCQIICTGNPDTADYSTTMMDNAILTRFIHVNLNFDKTKWAKWAIEKKIDSNCINFILSYPELIDNGQLTNPRTLTSFFYLIEKLKPFREHADLIHTIGYGLIDPEAVASFINFINNTTDKLISTEELLHSGDTDFVRNSLMNILNEGPKVRLDLFNTIFTRLLLFLEKNKVESINQDNIVEMFALPTLPNDYRSYMYLELNKIDLKPVKEILINKKVTLAMVYAS